jgi:hypothetical protein
MKTEDLRGEGAGPEGLEVHPLTDMFPLMQGSEFETLVEDIRQHGLLLPIVVDREGRLLDGRNRLRACLAAGVRPRFETWDGTGTAEGLILSLNMRRQHLNKSQRAMIAARMMAGLRRSRKRREWRDESAEGPVRGTIQ